MMKKVEIENTAETGWHTLDVQMAIATKREQVNDAVRSKLGYDAEEHNICLALIRFKDLTSSPLTAYSNDSDILETKRLGLGLIPDLYNLLPEMGRFGCDGMAHSHTEPKLLNYICATIGPRLDVLNRPSPKNPVYKSILEAQRQQAAREAKLLKGPEDIESVTLVTEIKCCPTCVKYSVERFEKNYPDIDLYIIELGKKAGGKLQLPGVTVTRTTN